MQSIKASYKYFSLFLLFTIGVTTAQNKYIDSDSQVITKKLGKASIQSNQTIQENLSEAGSFSHLLTIYNLIDFEGMIQDEEMVTVFIAENHALDFMTKKERESFLSSSNSTTLKEIISYFVIPGRVDEHAIRKAIADGSGATSFRSLDGKTIRFVLEGGAIILHAANGSSSELLLTNYRHNKGFFHITDGFAIP